MKLSVICRRADLSPSCASKEQMIRYATILLDIADNAGKVFDELLFEQRGNVCWLHFAVRPPGQQNRRKVAFIKA